MTLQPAYPYATQAQPTICRKCGDVAGGAVSVGPTGALHPYCPVCYAMLPYCTACGTRVDRTTDLAFGRCARCVRRAAGAAQK
jgi:hypothetical protein